MYNFGLAIFLLWHIGSVVVWLGVSLVFSYIIFPSLRTFSNDSQKQLFISIFPRFSKALTASSISTLIAGTSLFGYVSSIGISLPATGSGFAFIAVGAVLGLVGIIITLGVTVSMGDKLLARLTNPEALSTRDWRIKEGVLDEASMLKSLVSSTTAVTWILSLVLVMMVLGANV